MVYLSVPKLVHSPLKNSLRMSVCMCVFVCVGGIWFVLPECEINQHTHLYTYTQERHTLYSTVTMEMLGSFKGLHLHNGNCIYRCRPAVIHIKCSWLKLSMTNHSGCSQFVVTMCMFEQEFSEVNSEQCLKVCKLCWYSCWLHYNNLCPKCFCFFSLHTQLHYFKLML